MLRAITIRQPYARAVAAGAKTVENRGRPTFLRGRVAIHAARAVSRSGRVDSRITALFGDDPTVGAPLGAVVAVAELVDCHQSDGSCCRPWGERSYRDGTAYHLVLGSAVLLHQPVPCPGQLVVGWVLPPEVEREVRWQLAEVAR